MIRLEDLGKKKFFIWKESCWSLHYAMLLFFRLN